MPDPREPMEFEEDEEMEYAEEYKEGFDEAGDTGSGDSGEEIEGSQESQAPQTNIDLEQHAAKIFERIELFANCRGRMILQKGRFREKALSKLYGTQFKADLNNWVAYVTQKNMQLETNATINEGRMLQELVPNIEEVNAIEIHEIQGQYLKYQYNALCSRDNQLIGDYGVFMTKTMEVRKEIAIFTADANKSIISQQWKKVQIAELRNSFVELFDKIAAGKKMCKELWEQLKEHVAIEIQTDTLNCILKGCKCDVQGLKDDLEAERYRLWLTEVYTKNIPVVKDIPEDFVKKFEEKIHVLQQANAALPQSVVLADERKKLEEDIAQMEMNLEKEDENEELEKLIEDNEFYFEREEKLTDDAEVLELQKQNLEAENKKLHEDYEDYKSSLKKLQDLEAQRHQAVLKARELTEQRESRNSSHAMKRKSRKRPSTSSDDSVYSLRLENRAPSTPNGTAVFKVPRLLKKNQLK